MADQELLDKIEKVVDERIRPSLEMDGGGIDIIGLDEKKLSVQLHGACAHCPHAIETLKGGVERVLKAMVDQDIVVSAV